MSLIIHWIISALVIILIAYLLPGVTVVGFTAALITALVIGLINAFIKPILVLLTLPINILTLGLFTFIVNAVLILLASAVVPGFMVSNFWWALLFSILITVVSNAVDGLEASYE